MDEHTFMPGDRVIGVGKTDNLEMIGRIGTVVKPNAGYRKLGVLVRFDERFSNLLHNGDGGDRSEQSWFCKPKDLEAYREDDPGFTVPDLSELF